MLEILFEDNSILVINKPSGLNSIADGYDPNLPFVRSILEPDYGRLWVVHRLDKDTSGVMILARSADAHRNLNIQFTDRLIQKKYFALVFGDFPEKLNCSLPLRINGDRRHRTVIDEIIGKPASTDFSLSDRLSVFCSLITASPHTGLTHQIRAHLAKLNFPILCDPLYFSKESKAFALNLPIKRTALHAHSITFSHPVEKTQITISADLPEDFKQTINSLKESGAS
jgi:tRNA pseudouridine32 synthase / 23S rRNA pseudouridine746 synthase